MSLTLLEIILDSSTSQFDAEFNQIEVAIDQTVVPYTFINNSIVINQEIALGIHLLKIKLKTQAKLEISDVRLDGVSIRSAIYLSWTEQRNTKFNPNTCLEEINQVWVLPFSNPMSHWLTLAYEKISLQGYQHGDTLFDHCEIFYPKSIDIGPNYPQLLQDFFKYDFNFTVIEKNQDSCGENQGSLDRKHTHILDFIKDNNNNVERMQHDSITDKAINNTGLSILNTRLDVLRKLPYKTVDLGSVMEQTPGVYQEILDNYDFLLGMQIKLAQHQYNLVEDPAYVNNQWTVHHFRSIDKETGATSWDSTIDHLPKLKKFIDSMDIVDPNYVFVGVTPPRSYIAPHIDCKVNFETWFAPYLGCAQLYIPLTPNDQSLFKMAGVGLIPSGPCIINNSEYVHSVVNNQDCMRITLSIRLNIEKNLKFYK